MVLAGGASRRMGRDKATLPYPGLSPGSAPVITMVERTVAVLSERCAPVIVVAAAGQVLPEMAATVLRDTVPGQGPLPAAGLGLRAAAGAGCARAFLCAVDMPQLSAALIDELAAGDPDADIVLPWDGRDHYLAALYRTALADRVDALVASGERRMRALADVVRNRRVVLSEPGWLANRNSPVTGQGASDAGSRDQP